MFGNYFTQRVAATGVLPPPPNKNHQIPSTAITSSSANTNTNLSNNACSSRRTSQLKTTQVAASSGTSSITADLKEESQSFKQSAPLTSSSRQIHNSSNTPAFTNASNARNIPRQSSQELFQMNFSSSTASSSTLQPRNNSNTNRLNTTVATTAAAATTTATSIATKTSNQLALSLTAKKFSQTNDAEIEQGNEISLLRSSLYNSHHANSAKLLHLPNTNSNTNSGNHMSTIQQAQQYQQDNLLFKEPKSLLHKSELLSFATKPALILSQQTSPSTANSQPFPTTSASNATQNAGGSLFFAKQHFEPKTVAAKATGTIISANSTNQGSSKLDSSNPKITGGQSSTTLTSPIISQSPLNLNKFKTMIESKNSGIIRNSLTQTNSNNITTNNSRFEATEILPNKHTLSQLSSNQQSHDLAAEDLDPTIITRSQDKENLKHFFSSSIQSQQFITNNKPSSAALTTAIKQSVDAYNAPLISYDVADIYDSVLMKSPVKQQTNPHSLQQWSSTTQVKSSPQLFRDQNRAELKHPDLILLDMNPDYRSCNSHHIHSFNLCQSIYFESSENPLFEVDTTIKQKLGQFASMSQLNGSQGSIYTDLHDQQLLLATDHKQIVAHSSLHHLSPNSRSPPLHHRQNLTAAFETSNPIAKFSVDTRRQQPLPSPPAQPPTTTIFTSYGHSSPLLRSSTMQCSNQQSSSQHDMQTSNSFSGVISQQQQQLPPARQIVGSSLTNLAGSIVNNKKPKKKPIEHPSQGGQQVDVLTLRQEVSKLRTQNTVLQMKSETLEKEKHLYRSQAEKHAHECDRLNDQISSLKQQLRSYSNKMILSSTSQESTLNSRPPHGQPVFSAQNFSATETPRQLTNSQRDPSQQSPRAALSSAQTIQHSQSQIHIKSIKQQQTLQQHQSQLAQQQAAAQQYNQYNSPQALQIFDSPSKSETHLSEQQRQQQQQQQQQPNRLSPILNAQERSEFFSNSIINDIPSNRDNPNELMVDRSLVLDHGTDAFDFLMLSHINARQSLD